LLLGVRGLGGKRSVAAVTKVLPSSTSVPDTLAETTDTDAHVDDRRIIVLGTQRFEAGVGGDRVAVGDWDCDGVVTPAVLRPATGSLFVFDGWATEGKDVSIAPTRTIAGGVDVVARDHGNGCSTLVVVRDDGTEEEISS
jgi:hypothetical protein